MISLRNKSLHQSLSKRVFVFFLIGFLFFIFEGLIPLKFMRFVSKRNERDLDNEVKLLYQKIENLEKELSKNTIFANKEIPANIIFGGGYIFSDFILLDKGSKNGIEKNDLVIYKSTMAIAKIEEAFSDYSKATPFSRFDEKASLRSGPEKKILFEANGVGGREITALLPNGSGVDMGDSVYLSESPEFLVGIVETVEKRESRDFEEITIVLPFSLKSIVEVGVVKNNVKE